MSNSVGSGNHDGCNCGESGNQQQVEGITEAAEGMADFDGMGYYDILEDGETPNVVSPTGGRGRKTPRRSVGAQRPQSVRKAVKKVKPLQKRRVRSTKGIKSAQRNTRIPKRVAGARKVIKKRVLNRTAIRPLVKPIHKCANGLPVARPIAGNNTDYALSPSSQYGVGLSTKARKRGAITHKALVRPRRGK